jgi:transketolase
MFDADIEQVPTRNGFGEGLVTAGEANSQVVALCADLVESTRMLPFQKKFPERFVEIGVSEQNMASVASGMAAMGKVPVIASYAMFSPGRNWEQIRTTICYNDRKVIIAGAHAGISVGADGGTHQAIEDVTIMRVSPNMTVIVPCDSIEAKKAMMAAARDDKNGGTKTPVYLRLGREKTPVMTTEATPFTIGKAQIFYEVTSNVGGAQKSVHHDVGIIACGPLLHKAIKVAKALSIEGIAVKVMNLATIKPLDVEAIAALAKETGALVTVEEHQVAGGMGSAVAECLASYSGVLTTDVLTYGKVNVNVPIEFIGIKDAFGQTGTPDELIEYYKMGESHIRDAVKKVISRKART